MNDKWTVVVSTVARRDLLGIYDYLWDQTESLGTIRRLRAKIASRLKGLETVPFQGTKRDEICRGLRILPVGKVIIALFIDEPKKVVRIAGFFYGGQNYHAALEQREPDQ